VQLKAEPLLLHGPSNRSHHYSELLHYPMNLAVYWYPLEPLCPMNPPVCYYYELHCYPRKPVQLKAETFMPYCLSDLKCSANGGQ
jgi:hypothetical protein